MAAHRFNEPMLLWKDNWDRTRQRHLAWWEHQDLVLDVRAPRRVPLEPIDPPPPPESWAQYWLDPACRVWRAEHRLANTYFGGESFPFFDTNTGPGNLATFLGSEPTFTPESVWFEPCIDDPEQSAPLRFDPENVWYQRQAALIQEGLRRSQGRYLVSLPDLIENVDILASLRHPSRFLTDLIDRPEWVIEKVAEINQVFFAAFESLRVLTQDQWGGSCMVFNIWGTGRTAKVQCDASAMFSPAMFARFVLPALRAQCDWLDYSLYHLDGTAAIRHLDALLEIESLNAIEFTPEPTVPQGGSPRWVPMYRKILAAGKSVQAIQMTPEEVVPLLDAVGGKGMFIMTEARTEDDARRLEEQVAPYYSS